MVKRIAVVLLLIGAVVAPLPGCSKKNATTEQSTTAQGILTPAAEASATPGGETAPAPVATASAVGTPAPAAAVAKLITPPEGWNATTPPAGTVGAWIHPGDETFRQNVNLVSEQFSGTLDTYVTDNVKTLSGSVTGFILQSLTPTAICGDHPAKLLAWSATVRDQQIEFEQIATLWDSTAYVATYSRAKTQPELAEAVNSIKTVCAGK